MDIKDKIVKALSESLRIEYVRLEEDDGISGFVVSSDFQEMPTFERQERIDQALRLLSTKERRHILMIAGLTPAEYASAGARIRVHKVRESAGGAVEVLLHGGRADADYVRGALNNQKGVKTSEPESVPGAAGILMSFKAKGTPASPLTRARALRVLKKDPYIEVMPNA